MDFSIDKGSGASVHGQLVEQLKYHIEVGAWLPGEKLPTVRELSGAVRLNYNTVRAAYRTLEQDGYIVTQQGRGTFVAPTAPRFATSTDEETALDIIDEALAKALAAGIDPETFVRLSSNRARDFAHQIDGVRLLLIECNEPGLRRYAKQVEQGTGVRPTTLLVEAFTADLTAYVPHFDLIATTLFHIDEVREAMETHSLDADAVVALMIEPSYMHVVREITTLPPDTTVGLVCTTGPDAEKMARALRGIGAGPVHLRAAGIDTPDALAALFGEADRVYVSLQAQEAHDTPWPSDTPVYPYRDDVSTAALRLLRRRLLAVSGAHVEG